MSETINDTIRDIGFFKALLTEIKLSFKNRKPNSIKGCGCYLPAKQFSILNEVNKCPLNQWENFE
mgnify:CR=1 FL=1